MTNRNGLFLSGLGILLAVLILGAVKPVAADSIIVVTTTDDVIANDGLCSLREAVINANTDLGGIIFGECEKGSSLETDVIQLQGGFTYNITIAGAGEEAAATGDLDIMAEVFPDVDVLVEAVGGQTAVINVIGGIDRAWHIHDAEFTLRGVEVTGGGSDAGGGLRNDGGTVRLENSSFTLNSATAGGAIYSNGNGAYLRLVATSVSRNTSFPGVGGGIYNAGGLLVAIDSTISGSIAADGGGGLHNDNGNVTLTRTRFAGNKTDGCGGGIANTGVGVITLIDSDITGVNESEGDGGGLCNEATMSLTVGTLVFANEAQGDGGGIYNAGNLIIRNSRIENNKAFGNVNNGFSGGLVSILGSSVELHQSAIVGNQSLGASLVLRSATLLAFNSTISNNSGNSTGGLYISGGSSHATLINVTMVDNETTVGGGGSGLFVLNGTAVIGNSIIANTTQAFSTCGDNNGTITSLGHNVGDDATCFGGITDFINTDPMLSPLVDGVQTPQINSPVIDAADMLLCSETAVYSTDQIGQSRPMFNGCDIGAIEWTGMQVYLPVIIK